MKATTNMTVESTAWRTAMAMQLNKMLASGEIVSCERCGCVMGPHEVADHECDTDQ